jgi:hypothetical protein
MPLSQKERKEFESLQAMEQAEELDQVKVGQGTLSEEEKADFEQLKALDKETEDVSAAESVARGALQGVSLGLSDEVEGTIAAGVRKLTGDDTPFSEAYRQERDIVRRENYIADQANPYAAGIGTFAGGVIPALLTGGTTGTLAGFRAAASIGGLSGLGFSNATGSELVGDVAIGTALGMGGEAVFKGVGKLIGNLVKKTNPTTVKALDVIGETKHPHNVSFETNIYKQALKGGFKDMDSFFSSKEAQKTATSWAQQAHSIPKDLLRLRKEQAKVKLKSIMHSPENANTKVNVTDLVEELQTGETGLKNFRSQGTQKQAVDSIEKEILKPIKEGTLKLAGRPTNISNLDFEQAIEFKRLVNELTFQNADPLLDSMDQMAFRRAPAVSQRLKQFAGEVMERTNGADKTGELQKVNEHLFNIIEAEQLSPKNLKELQALSNNFGTDQSFFKGQQFLMALDKVDTKIKQELSQEIVPTLTLVDAVTTAQQWNVGVSTLFQAKAGASAIGPVGALVALGKGGSLLATQAVGKAAKQAFKIPRTIGGILQNKEIFIQKVADLNPALAITLNDMIHDRNVDGIKGIIEQALADPQLATQFEPGIGFEGKVTNPEEEAKVRQEIMGTPISLSDKIRMVQELETTKRIPQPPQQALPPITLKPSAQKAQDNKRNLNLVRKAEKELNE